MNWYFVPATSAVGSFATTKAISSATNVPNKFDGPVPPLSITYENIRDTLQETKEVVHLLSVGQLCEYDIQCRHGLPGVVARRTSDVCRDLWC